MADSIEYFLKTWTVTQSDSEVEKGQRINIERPNPNSNDLKFSVPPKAAPGEPGGFGDDKWASVKDLKFNPAEGTVTGTAEVAGKTNLITIRAKHVIHCEVTPPGPSPLAETAGEWEADDEGGGT